jgi:hypothetical protein
MLDYLGAIQVVKETDEILILIIQAEFSLIIWKLEYLNKL